MRSRRLGATLRRYREAARLDQAQAGEYIAGSKAKISRIESGESSARPGDVRLLLELYGVEDAAVRSGLEQLARDSNKRGWWLDQPWSLTPEYADLIAMESDASYIRSWQPVMVPGLLQIPEYTRLLLDSGLVAYSDAEADDILATRQARKRVIDVDGTQLAAIIWEPALTSPMPDVEAHRAQLRHLRDAAGRQNISLQVLPMDEWQAARACQHFVMFSFGPEPAAEAVSLDTLSSSVILEGPEDLARYARAFEALRSAALTPTQTLSFLDHALKNIATG
ncbi:helix-turn-helix domain-containing protein [Streptomyces sp. NPDC021020]|uniref:helix-turn-helix domain-containing protein n=1 Tax=Streptomyces sp. NPDC021020 TaxID=3365109 RepID=UPI0037A2A1F0